MSSKESKKSQDTKDKVKNYFSKKNVKRTIGAGIPGISIIEYRGERNAALYNKVKQELENYCMIHYNKNSYIFENGSEYEYPEVDGIDDDELTVENDPHGLAKAKYVQRIKNREVLVSRYEENKSSVYGIVWGQCSSEMRSAIMLDADYPEFSSEKDPLKLWNAITAILLIGTTVPDEKEEVVQAKAELQYARMYQRQDETIADFYQRFSQEVEALVPFLFF
jgi:hypothetical protein